MGINHIIWDWNGTLLNDIDVSVKIVNQLLKNRGLPAISLQHHRQFFRFPIQQYYEKLGFNFSKESFQSLSENYIGRYLKLIHQAPLQRAATKILKTFQRMGIGQSLLSAMEKNILFKMVRKFKLESFFQKIVGIDNFRADSKLNQGKRFIEQRTESPRQILMIGDTEHDLEVARVMGCQCILFSGGHQTGKKLKLLGVPVISRLAKVLDYV